MQSKQPPKTDTPKITIVKIKTPLGDRQIPLPENASKLLNQYNDESSLSQKLGESIIAIQKAKTRSELQAQTLLIELLTLSNQSSMQLGEIKGKKELDDMSAKKTEGEEEIIVEQQKSKKKKK